LLESALARPRHAALYEDADLAAQAATLVWGLTENQPFIDGNKRTALVVGLTFLRVNGYSLEMSEDQRYQLMIDIASGLGVDAVATALRGRMRTLPTE
jgi:death-on-curing protein